MGRSTAAGARYWLAGAELCEHCLQHYVYEEEYRCSGCDGPLCRDCVVSVRETLEVLCPDCVPAEPAAEG